MAFKAAPEQDEPMTAGKTAETAETATDELGAAVLRVTDLEIRITHQSEMLEQLNDVIYAQQKQIDLLVKKLASLEKQAGNPAPANEKPPHY